MRIGINASFARKQNTGIGQVTINLLKKLATRCDTYDTRCKNFEFYVYFEEETDLKLPAGFKKRVFLPFWKRDDLIRKILWEKFSLPWKVKEDKCDVFISLYQSATVLSGDIKHIMVVHDVIPKLLPEYLNNSRKKIYQKLIEKGVREADKIIAVSHRTEKDIIQNLSVPPSKITVSYIDVDEIYKNEISENENMRVLAKYNLSPGYIYNGGGLEVRKNVEGLVRAYKLLLEKNKKEQIINNFPKLVISGKLMPQLAPLVTDVEKLLKELNLTQHVELLDFVPQKDLPAIYRNALMFAYPSFYEGFGLPVLEAMSQGTPVIASKKSSLPEVGGDSVLYCDPSDEEDIAMVMKNVLVNKDLRKVLSQKGKNRADNFSWERFVEKILNIAESL
ncbi:mannosylfructose-phosphate synthase [bacterium BMS3Abin15]|nr:mannosylfructose-phosphate synthase [bacterium BMS3Abin15]HDZ85492.1 glycosyltransferase family 1 protein [Candidatus Moranbacteria bacterium]